MEKREILSRFGIISVNEIVALVPMLEQSQRVPGKNYRLLVGKPLFHHVIESLVAVPEINTDSDPVIDGLRKSFLRLKR